MSVELPADYQPSLPEDYMNPMQIEYFRRRLQQSRTLRHPGLFAVEAKLLTDRKQKARGGQAAYRQHSSH